VRQEIVTAYRLKRRVIPILVGDATMPSNGLLPELLRMVFIESDVGRLG
jgi:hypothetical protein